MARAGLRIGIFGATGALGGEVLAVLADSGLPVAEIVPMAKDDSIGRDVELHGEVYAVESGMARLRGLDFVILCAPAAASLDARARGAARERALHRRLGRARGLSGSGAPGGRLRRAAGRPMRRCW